MRLQLKRDKVEEIPATLPAGSEERPKAVTVVLEPKTPRPGVRVQHHNGRYYTVFIHTVDIFTSVPMVVMMAPEDRCAMYSVRHDHMHEQVLWPDGEMRCRFVDTRQLPYSKTNPEGIKP